MQSAWRPESRKYSPIAQPAPGAMYRSGADPAAAPAPPAGARPGRRGEGEGAGVLEDLHGLGHGGALLADRHVEAEDPLPLLVDDRVDRDRGLAGAAIADDQLTLTAPDRDHRVDGLDAGLQRLLHRAPVHHAGGIALDRPELLGVDRALAVDRLAQGVDHAAHQRLADRHLGDALGARHRVAFLDLG